MAISTKQRTGNGPSVFAQFKPHDTCHMTRIAIAGFQHETNSFATTVAGLAEFEMADSWPGLLRGSQVISGTKGMNLAIAGFVEAAETHDNITLLPILWCAAEPSANVTAHAFDTITGWLLEGLRDAAPFDGIFLDLHGAMITDTDFDGESALLERIREAFGADIPIAITLDFHANLTQRLVDLATSISIYRTYPHLDMAATGARALPRLLDHIAGGRSAKALKHLPYLVPLYAQYTSVDPLQSVFETVARTQGAELAMGFTGADMPEMGPAVLTYAATQAEADKTEQSLYEMCLAAEPCFAALPQPPDVVVAQALQYPSGKPVVIADVEDNAGGGGSSDTTGLLRALVDAGATGAILGVMHDPDIAALAHKLGTGATLTAPLGGRSGCDGDAPFVGSFTIEGLSDGAVPFEGQMYGGGTAQIGPTALLRVVHPTADIQIVVSSVRNQCLDRGYFRHIGLTPETARIICVKSTVHFRADFDPIAQATLYTAVPGALASDLTKVPFRHLRAGVRLGPLGPNNESSQPE